MQKKLKNKPVFWSFEARRNLDLIFDHISFNFSRDRANVRIQMIMNEVESLSEFPRKGKISIHFNEMRELIVEGNIIYYRNNEADIVIASIRARRTTAKKK